MTEIEPNGVRFDPARSRGHVESYFLKINDPQRPRALWLKATILHREKTPAESAVAESWVVCFDREHGHVGHKTTIPIGDARFGKGPDLDVEVASCTLSGARAHGAIEDVAWDLALEPHAPPLYVYGGARMYRGRLPSQKSLSIFPDLTTSGTVRVRGETWNVAGWRGSLGHNWGTRHTHLYAWGQISAWDAIGASPENASDLVFEGATGRVALGPLVVPPLSVFAVRWRGVRYEWNALSQIPKNRGHIVDLRRWTFSASNALGSIEGELEADTNDFVGLGYENPNGKMTYCLNSKLARARLRLELSGRAPFEATSQSAALEIGTHDPKHGVTMVA
jgi:hypothetical protein